MDRLALTPVPVTVTAGATPWSLYEDDLPVSDAVTDGGSLVWFLRRRPGNADVVMMREGHQRPEPCVERLKVLEMKGPFLAGVVVNRGHELVAVDDMGMETLFASEDRIMQFDVTSGGGVLCITQGRRGWQLHLGTPARGVATIAEGQITGAVWTSEHAAVFLQHHAHRGGGSTELLAVELDGQRTCWGRTEFLISPEMAGDKRGSVFVAGGPMGSNAHGGWVLGPLAPTPVASTTDLPLHGRPLFLAEAEVLFPTYLSGGYALVEAREDRSVVHPLPGRPSRSIAVFPATRRVIWAQPTSEGGGRLFGCDLPQAPPLF